MKVAGRERTQAALRAVMPPGTTVRVAVSDSSDLVRVDLGPSSLRTLWLDAGWPGRVQDAHRAHPDVQLVVAPEISPGARELLTNLGVAWADETGAAQIVTEQLVVARDGRRRIAVLTKGWAPATLGVAEALLTGTPATVNSVQKATGLSVGASSNALSFLTEQNLLDSDKARGPESGRRVADPRRLLEAYTQHVPTRVSRDAVRVGVLWRDPVIGATDLGQRWTSQKVTWAATGALAAAVMEPLLTQVAPLHVYVAAKSFSEMALAMRAGGLEQTEGGRLMLTPFPTSATQHLATSEGGLRCVPWPRVFADLRPTGVRGEEAAEHLAAERLRRLAEQSR